MVSTSLLRCRTSVIGFLLILLSAGLIVGCGEMKGSVDDNQPPVVEFANVPADSESFSNAPIVYWKGRDSDGFVERYYYADVTDSSALLNPREYIPFIPREAWVLTVATFDTVHLLTESGLKTEHIFYLKCQDDRGAESDVAIRTFYRTNHAPRIPQIKWSTSDDSTFGRNVTLSDTFYCLEEVTDDWAGLGFTWRSNDPDDKELYRIPLQYMYYLEKTPHDTVWEWVSHDWTEHQSVTLTGLETGNYRLTVWARDDGYELCADSISNTPKPASIVFNVYKPTFERPVLLYNVTVETATSPFDEQGVTGSMVGDTYKSLIDAYKAAHPGFTYEYIHQANRNSKYWYKSYLGRFQLIILFNERYAHNVSPWTDSSRAADAALADYLRVGGKIWIVGDFLQKNKLIYADNSGLMRLSNCTWGQVPIAGNGDKANFAEFTGAVAGVYDLKFRADTLSIDTSKTSPAFDRLWRNNYKLKPLMPGVDNLTAGDGVETAYFFKSYTDTANGVMYDRPASVVDTIGAMYYPPTPMDCMIKLDNIRVLRVDRIWNKTRTVGTDSVFGRVISFSNSLDATRTVVHVSYPYGRAWAKGDSLRVDYTYQPFSQRHLRPCGIRYEKLQATGSGSSVAYRIAVFTFPLYYLDNSHGRVTYMFARMLDWFFSPYAQ